MGYSIENGAALKDLPNKFKKFWKKVDDIIVEN